MPIYLTIKVYITNNHFSPKVAFSCSFRYTAKANAAHELSDRYPDVFIPADTSFTKTRAHAHTHARPAGSCHHQGTTSGRWYSGDPVKFRVAPLPDVTTRPAAAAAWSRKRHHRRCHIGKWCREPDRPQQTGPKADWRFADKAKRGRKASSDLSG